MVNFSCDEKEATYRLRNWSDDNRSLRQRGRLTVRISPAAVARWTTEELTGGPGASPTYTDLARQHCWSVGAVVVAALGLMLSAAVPSTRGIDVLLTVEAQMANPVRIQFK